LHTPNTISPQREFDYNRLSGVAKLREIQTACQYQSVFKDFAKQVNIDTKPKKGKFVPAIIVKVMKSKDKVNRLSSQQRGNIWKKTEQSFTLDQTTNQEETSFGVLEPRLKGLGYHGYCCEEQNNHYEIKTVSCEIVEILKKLKEHYLKNKHGVGIILSDRIDLSIYRIARRTLYEPGHMLKSQTES